MSEKRGTRRYGVSLSGEMATRMKDAYKRAYSAEHGAIQRMLARGAELALFELTGEGAEDGSAPLPPGQVRVAVPSHTADFVQRLARCIDAAREGADSGNMVNSIHSLLTTLEHLVRDGK